MPQVIDNNQLTCRLTTVGGSMCPECRHIMPSGAKCHALALRGMPYCYFHARGHRPAQGQGRIPKQPLKLPVLKDSSAIQVALGQVLSAIASSKINARSAGQLLYGIQIASDNVRRAAQAAPIAEK